MKESNGDKNLVAYCGLCCKDCHGYSGKVADLARDLRKELRQTNYDKFAAFLSNYSFGRAYKKYPECYEVLGQMVKFRCRKGCRQGGGSPFCKIRKCCLKRGFNGCWECKDFEECKNLDFLIPVHGDAHIKNLRLIGKKGINEFTSGKTHWYSEIKE
ncbi:MAG: DUF3795 domain-containing protein [Dehalococcoidia bacterium]|nr:MAG: DUF3795 domain-containing protein [Dehalococcoidia bacterium]